MKKPLILILIIAICVSSTAATFENCSYSNQKEIINGDIIPNRYRGHTYKEMSRNVRYNIGMAGVVLGTHFGQYLNSSYGKLMESGQLSPKPGLSIGANLYQYYPVIISAEYSINWDKFGEYTNHNKSFAGYVSLAAFPWFYKGGGIFIPNIGIGLQHSVIGPEWKPTHQTDKDPDDKVSQVLYKIGFIINIPIKTGGLYALQLVGNYYRSLFTKDQPHALNAVTIGIGFSGF